jgi:hypothetical protein
MAILARVANGRLEVDFDPQGTEGLGPLFEAVAKIGGDYSATLARVREILVRFARPDTERKIYAWMQGALANGKTITVQALSPEAHTILRAEQDAGLKAWSALLPPNAPSVVDALPGQKRATKPLMRPTSRIPKPNSPA